MAGESVCIETYGCSYNVADGEALAGVLAQAGYRVVAEPAAADVIVMNTCTVKDRTFLEFEKRFRRLKRAAENGSGPRLVIAGCIPKAYERSDLLAGVSTMGPDSIPAAAEVVRRALDGENSGRARPLAPDSSSRDKRLELPARRRDPLVEILPISAGCLSACAFCQTRFARGRLRSFRPSEIVGRARRAIGEGVAEIWLTSQDTGAYGMDCGASLAGLLRRLCDLEGDFRIRLGMSSPLWIWQSLDAILEALAHPRMFQFLHLPVQSGSDRVLKAMKRGNTASQFVEVCDAFRERFPWGALMTDIIIGFPGETRADFDQTLQILERVTPAAANRSKFSPRPGTAAAGMPPLPGAEVARRSDLLNIAVRRIASRWHRRWIGRSERVRVAEIKRKDSVLAYNLAYRPVNLPGSWSPGTWLDVTYTGSAEFHLRAAVDQDRPPAASPAF